VIFRLTVGRQVLSGFILIISVFKEAASSCRALASKLLRGSTKGLGVDILRILLILLLFYHFFVEF